MWFSAKVFTPQEPNKDDKKNPIKNVIYILMYRTACGAAYLDKKKEKNGQIVKSRFRIFYY